MTDLTTALKEDTRMTIQRIKSEIRKMDKNVKGEQFKTAVILMSSAIIGPNVKKLAEFTGYGKDEIATRAQRLRQNGVWKNGKVACNWKDEKSGGVEFWLDVLVADGMLKIVTK